VIRTAGESFFEYRPKWFSWLHLKVLNAILRCRTAALGGHADACSKCGHEVVSYNSCRNRHCPKCQANARDRWLEARSEELLPTRYVHVVFTLPRQPAPLTLQNKREIYGLLFRASAETLIEVARDPKRLGAEIGFFSVLHTWNQKLEAHPHVHCVVPAGGLAPDHSRWIDSQQKFFLPVDVLKEVFRGKFVEGLKTLHAEHKLDFHGTLTVLRESQSLRSLAPSVVPLRMGGLFQTAVRRSTTRATLSRSVHPSRGDLKPSTRHPGRWHDHFSLARFRSPQQEASDDAAGQRVPAKIPVARAAAWIRPRPLFRPDGSSPPRRGAPALLATAGPVRSVSQS
jgi:hypothetical protein